MTESSDPTGAVPVSTRILMLADRRPDAVALTTVQADGSAVETTWRQLADGVVAAASDLRRLGVRAGNMIAIALPKCPEHFMAAYGAWHIGARPLMLNSEMTSLERSRILALARPSLVVSEGDWSPDAGVLERAVRRGGGWPTIRDSADVLPEPPLVANFAIATGGSSGAPKIILSPFPGSFVDTGTPPDEALTGRTSDMIQLVNGPLYHNSPCTLAYGGLLWGHHLVVMERFDAARALELIESYHVSFVPTVPTVMKRMLDAYQRVPRDVSSIRSLFHTGASCPPAVKEGWIALIGAERVHEAFGGSELIGTTVIRGDEWLTHRGSVGRPVEADLIIVGDSGETLPPGEIGEIFMRSHRAGPSYEYVGETSNSRRDDGFESLGDLGWVSADGYLFIADRRVDMIISGGENIYPAEIENVLLDHTAVGDAVVVGVSDAEWGRRVHALVQPTDPHVTPADLISYCRQHLSSYKVPKVIEFVESIPRDPESGKIRRAALVSEIEARSPDQKPRICANRS